MAIQFRVNLIFTWTIINVLPANMLSPTTCQDSSVEDFPLAKGKNEKWKEAES